MKNEFMQNKYLIDQYNPIHFIKRFLIKKEVKNICQSNKINQIADLGCGFGIISQELAKFAKVDGYDINSAVIKFARQITHLNNLNFYVQNIFNIRKNNYDLALCSEVLEYIANDSAALEKINKILRPHGHLILTVPINKSLTTEFDEREKFRRYSLNELIKKLCRTGFEVKKTRYWGYPLLSLFYFYIYIPRSNKEAVKENKDYRFSKLTLFLLKYLGYIFLIDLLFNSKKSLGLLIVAQKK
jgi:SAM-dependent methyltransferase